ncbi:hypothetical protein PUNSTDRAFT_135579 [Punctularia strigosozonata HHB-11173 SS5]|uniref:uncharacterized protein n=1 Tax=Punctularia strigosozonata (strain HHB-11173) TaxID=741275 RepID=UPI00044174C9|nr:uncharacterized protein PUNSTDRAFT_135579 [Punctularia strigosozonata HHB-11173 SS5]EIN08064.1 hypothetical protein PUNSTDRAFT_135579 [Punctularia strigosozonata HHB-11173 SS5]
MARLKVRQLHSSPRSPYIRPKRGGCGRWNHESRSALLEALDLSRGTESHRDTAQKRVARPEFIRDFIFKKTGACPDVKSISDEMKNMHFTTERRLSARDTSATTCFHLDGTSSDPSASTEAPMPSVITTPASPIRNLANYSLATGSADQAELPPSMSRRRRAMNMPTLHSQMQLPPLSLSMPRMSSPRNLSPVSPATAVPSTNWFGALNRPNLTLRGSSADSMPRTPLEQMVHTPLNPPEVPKAPPPMPRRRGDLTVLWNDRWSPTPEDLFTPLPGKTFGVELPPLSAVKSTTGIAPALSSSSSSGNATPSPSSTLDTLALNPSQPPYPLPSNGNTTCTVNPMVHFRLNPRPRHLSLPRRSTYQHPERCDRKTSITSPGHPKPNLRIIPPQRSSADSPLASPLIIKPMTADQILRNPLSPPTPAHFNTPVSSASYFNVNPL